MNRWKKWLAPILMLAFVFPLLAPPAGALNLQRIIERYACTVAENVTIGNLLMIKSDGLCYKADADDATLRPAIGVAASTVSSGGVVGLVARGIVGGASALTPGGAMYLSTVAGAATQTQPSAYSQTVGRAAGTTSWGIDINPPQTLKVLTIAVENLAAAADIGTGTDYRNARAIAYSPVAMTINDVKIYGRDSLSVYAYGNVVRVFNEGATVVEKSYNTATVWPAAFTATSIGTIANANVAAGKSIFFEIVNGVLCDPPAFDLLIYYFTGE